MQMLGWHQTWTEKPDVIELVNKFPHKNRGMNGAVIDQMIGKNLPPPHELGYWTQQCVIVL